MRTGFCLLLAHLTVFSCTAVPSHTRDQEFFCFHTKSELGRTQCNFLRRPSAGASILFYWTIWTADHRVEECFISAEPALIQNYMSVCAWDLQKTSSLSLNITLLLEPGSPCEFQPPGHGDLRWHRSVDREYPVGFRPRMRQKRAWIFPGTLWCGRGSRAGDYEQLGMFERVDSCCREHDHCERIIRPFTVNFGVFNPTLFTISHCQCDYRFKQCLHNVNDTVSNMVGYTFFNMLKVQCFELVQKKRCTKLNWIGMCTSNKVAPYAILKHATMFNATTSNTGISDLPVYRGKLSATTKQKNKKPKREKQSTSQQSWAHGKPKSVSPAFTTAQPKGLMNCNTTLFHRKSKHINQRTLLPAAVRSTADSNTKTATASAKPIATTPKKMTQNKRKNITQWPNLTVQTKSNNRYKPLTSKLNRDPPRGARFRPKLQKQRKDGKQGSASLHNTVSPNFVAVSLASNHPKMNTFCKRSSQSKKEAHFSSRKNTSLAVSSKSPPKITSTEMNHKSSEISELPKIWNNTNSAFKPTAICDVTRHLDDCKHMIRPMEKLYGLYNTDTTTIYHCGCIQRLTDHIKQLEITALLENLLRKFVSMSCIEMPSTKECNSNTRCSPILCEATELESSLSKLEGRVTKEFRKKTTKERVSIQLHKRCLMVLRSRRRVKLD